MIFLKNLNFMNKKLKKKIKEKFFKICHKTLNMQLDIQQRELQI